MGSGCRSHPPLQLKLRGADVVNRIYGNAPAFMLLVMTMACSSDFAQADAVEPTFELEDVTRLSLVSSQTVPNNTNFRLSADGQSVVAGLVEGREYDFRRGIPDSDGRLWSNTGRDTDDGVNIWRVQSASGVSFVAVRNFIDSTGDYVLVADVHDDDTVTLYILSMR